MKNTSDPSVLCGFLQRLGFCFEMEELARVLEKTLKIDSRVGRKKLRN